MNKLNEYYNELNMKATPEDMAQRVISADAAEKPKRMAFRKPAVIAATAAVLMVGGVTAGAATGLFNFNEVFDTVSVEDEAFGQTLLGGVSNLKATVSNDDYVVELKGVTGSHASLLANIEISRADGQPITALRDVNVGVSDIILQQTSSFSGGGWSSRINADGKLSIDWEYRLSYDDLLNGKESVEGATVIGGSVNFDDNGEAVPLDWKLEFDYTPSEESLRSVKAVDTDENCTLCSEFNEGGEHKELECDISDITLTSTFGVIRGVITDEVFLMPCREDNDIKLIKNDGTEINTKIGSVNGDDDGNSLNFILHYLENESIYSDELAVNLAEIKAISINGTVYELS